MYGQQLSSWIPQFKAHYDITSNSQASRGLGAPSSKLNVISTQRRGAAVKFWGGFRSSAIADGIDVYASIEHKSSFNLLWSPTCWWILYKLRCIGLIKLPAPSLGLMRELCVDWRWTVHARLRMEQNGIAQGSRCNIYIIIASNSKPCGEHWVQWIKCWSTGAFRGSAWRENFLM